MAKKPKIEEVPGETSLASVASVPKKSAPTGTLRVLAGGKVKIPGPQLQADDQDETPEKSKADQDKPEEKQKEAPFTVVSSQHIITNIARNADQNRLSRLQDLARTNLDVRWLLARVQVSDKKPAKKKD